MRLSGLVLFGVHFYAALQVSCDSDKTLDVVSVEKLKCKQCQPKRALAKLSRKTMEATSTADADSLNVSNSATDQAKPENLEVRANTKGVQTDFKKENPDPINAKKSDDAKIEVLQGDSKAAMTEKAPINEVKLKKPFCKDMDKCKQDIQPALLCTQSNKLKVDDLKPKQKDASTCAAIEEAKKDHQTTSPNCLIKKQASKCSRGGDATDKVTCKQEVPYGKVMGQDIILDTSFGAIEDIIIDDILPEKDVEPFVSIVEPVFESNAPIGNSWTEKSNFFDPLRVPNSPLVLPEIRNEANLVLGKMDGGCQATLTLTRTSYQTLIIATSLVGFPPQPASVSSTLVTVVTKLPSSSKVTTTTESLMLRQLLQSLVGPPATLAIPVPITSATSVSQSIPQVPQQPALPPLTPFNEDLKGFVAKILNAHP
jgi:hypothetical protein